MTWSRYWLHRARTVSEHRKRVYGLEPPPPLQSILGREARSLSPADSLRILVYTLFGSPGERLGLFWRFLSDRDTPRRRRKIDALAGELRERLSVGCPVVEGYFERRIYSRDLAGVPPLLEKALHRTTPLLAVRPRTEGDVAALVDFASERGIPLFPRGVSSSAFGGSVPTKSGIVVDFSAMMEVLEIDPRGRTARVQPGVRWADLAELLEPFGLVPVTTPTSRFSTIGGWLSTGGIGLESFAYGPLAEAVVSARVAIPDGTVREVRDRHREEKEEGDRLRDFIGTEGQFGLFTEITLKVRPRPGFSRARLLPFDSPRSAFDFVERVFGSESESGERGIRPAHIAFFDRERLAEENVLFRDRTGLAETILAETDALLLHFDDPAEEARFGELLAGEAGLRPAGDTGASYLWAERFFPLKARRLGLDLLAAEAVLPRRSVPDFIDLARRLARAFGCEPAFEATFFTSREGCTKSKGCREEEGCVVIASYPADSRKGIAYLLRMLLAMILTAEALRLGGRPYGYGIWNAPFWSRRYPSAVRRQILRRKERVDPKGILNPMKHFRHRTRFYNLPGLLFRPRVFGGFLRLAGRLSPLVALVSPLFKSVRDNRWRVPAPEEEGGRKLLVQSIRRCTFCGSCISVCPAYYLTRDELVTGRAKLRMAEAMVAGEEISTREASSPFQCLRCGLCEEVCQTRLPLKDCYTALEGWIEGRIGRPDETMARFTERLDADRTLVETLYGLDVAEWRPGQEAGKLGERHPEVHHEEHEGEKKDARDAWQKKPLRST